MYMDKSAAFYSHYGALVIFDPAHEIRPDDLDLSSFRPWLEAHQVVVWDEAQGEHHVRVADELTELEGVPTATAYLTVQSGEVWLGSSEAVNDGYGEHLAIKLRPGDYRVTVAEVSPSDYAVHFKPVDAIPEAAPRRPLFLGLERRHAMLPVPVLKQTRFDAPSLTEMLERVGSAAKTIHGRGPGPWLFHGTVSETDLEETLDVRDAQCILATTSLESRLARTALKLEHRFLQARLHEGPILYLWARPEGVAWARPLGVAVTIVDDQVTMVSLCTRFALSQQDLDECLHLVRSGFTAPGPTARPINRPNFKTTQCWESDKLTVLVGPLAGRKAPRILVSFQHDHGQEDTSVALPIRLDDDHAVYELWLIGPRVVCRAAEVELLA
jgi:hypothetical protein